MAEIHLSETQLDLMRSLWALGRATTAEIYRHVDRPRSAAYTTVATTLARMEKRGLIRSVKDEAGERVFEPLVTENEVTRSMVSSLVATLFHGDPGALVSHLVRESEVGEGDLEKVRRMLDDEERR